MLCVIIKTNFYDRESDREVRNANGGPPKQSLSRNKINTIYTLKKYREIINYLSDAIGNKRTAFWEKRITTKYKRIHTYILGTD